MESDPCHAPSGDSNVIHLTTSPYVRVYCWLIMVVHVVYPNGPLQVLSIWIRFICTSVLCEWVTVRNPSRSFQLATYTSLCVCVVCICVCTCVCMYVCVVCVCYVYVCMCVGMCMLHVCVRACIFVCMYVRVLCTPLHI